MAIKQHGLSHAEVATQYAKDVVVGIIPACKQVKQAAMRHLNDLESSKQEDYPYFYDNAAGSRPCKFIELLPHIEGPLAKTLIKLEPWQCFIICSLFGWLRKKNNLRRFRRAYICVPRKNAKSTILAGLSLYCLALDGEGGAQVYCGAGSKEQAKAVWIPAQAMAKATPALSKKFGVVVNADSIVIPDNNSRFTRLIGNPGDGMSPHLAVIDEFHEHLDSRLYDAMTMGMGARSQPLAIVITTAGSDTSSPCYFLQKDMEKVLDGTTDNPTRFAIVYTIDTESYTFNGVDYPADDWTSEEALIKANPNWGISVDAEELLVEQKEAILASEKQNTFKTKKLDVWCFAKSGYFNVQKWNDCADPTLNIEDFLGQPCVKGLDLASQEDLAADVTVFQKMVEDPNTLVSTMHYYVFPKCYIPEDTVAMPTNQHYQKWVHDGHLISTPGNEIALAFVKNNIIADIAKFDVRELDFDKYQGTFLKQEVVAETGVEGVEIAQSRPVMDIPMKWLRGMINAGRIHHDGNPVMTWCISNVVSREDSRELDAPDKERPESKIDAVSALLFALARIRAVLGEDTGYYEYTGF